MTTFALAICSGLLGQVEPRDPRIDRLFLAIRMVETGSHAEPHNALGDGGKSLGPYQISRKYLADSGLRGHWTRCSDRKYAEAVMLAYWRRHCPEALKNRDYQTLARVHNGGPMGHRKSSTLSYWRLVQGILKSEEIAARSAGPGSRKRSRMKLSHIS